MELEAEEKKVHLGRNVGKTREILGMKQIVLAEKTGMSQQNISKLEQSEEIPDETLEKLAKGLGVSTEFVRSFREDKAIQYIQNNSDNSSHASQNYQPTFNYTGLEKISEMLQQFIDLEKKRFESFEKRLDDLERKK